MQFSFYLPCYWPNTSYHGQKMYQDMVDQAKFAEELAKVMGCIAESQERLPESEFVAEALRPPPIYFERDGNAEASGICCVCYKPGVMGKCPNPSCGLLMHLTCVP